MTNRQTQYTWHKMWAGNLFAKLSSITKLGPGPGIHLQPQSKHRPLHWITRLIRIPPHGHVHNLLIREFFFLTAPDLPGTEMYSELTAHEFKARAWFMLNASVAIDIASTRVVEFWIAHEIMICMYKIKRGPLSLGSMYRDVYHNQGCWCMLTKSSPSNKHVWFNLECNHV